MRSCGGSSTRRRCRICSGAKRPRRSSKPRPADCERGVRRAGRTATCASSPPPAARATRRARSRAPPGTATAYGRGAIAIEPLGRDPDGPRFALVASPRPIGHPVMRRLRMIAAVARQGFALCAARDRPLGADRSDRRSIARAAAARLPLRQRRHGARRRTDSAAAGQRPDGADHRRERHRQGAGGARDSRRVAPQRRHVPALQLHDDRTRSCRQPAVRPSARQLHRRRLRSARVWSGRPRAARCFSTKSATCRSTCSPSCCAFSSSRRSCRSARRGRSAWTSASSRRPTPISNSASPKASSARTSTTASTVIRIHVPPLRERREEIPHLSTYFLREAMERLGKPDIHLSSETLDVFSQYWWPGNVRQLKNEIQRAVALSAPGGTVDPSHLSPEIGSPSHPAGATMGRLSRNAADARRRRSSRSSAT